MSELLLPVSALIQRIPKEPGTGARILEEAWILVQLEQVYMFTVATVSWLTHTRHFSLLNLPSSLKTEENRISQAEFYVKYVHSSPSNSDYLLIQYCMTF
jgi:hypothetical protein